MAKKKEAQSPDASVSRLTRAPKAAAPKAARKRSRLPDEAVSEFASPGITLEIPPPESTWSPVERIHLEELVVEESQIEESRPTTAPAACNPPPELSRDIPWLPPSARAILQVAMARMNRSGLLARLLDRGRPYAERVLNRVSRFLARRGW